MFPTPALLGLALSSVLLVGCATDGAGSAQPNADTSYSSLLLQPMNALPPCASPPTPAEPTAPVEGLILPEGAVVLTTSEQQGLTQAIGYVELTPVQLLVEYERFTTIRIVQREHEQFESELLYETRGDDVHRAFVKAQVACATGSNFVAVVAAPGAAGAVPTPSGNPAPPTP